MEPDEGLEKLQTAFHICAKYRENYEDRKAHLAEYFKDKPVVEWDFESSLVFARVDRLTGQLKLIEVISHYDCSVFPHFPIHCVVIGLLPTGILPHGEPVLETGEDRIQWSERTDAERPGCRDVHRVL